jgi:hypothetical protein
VSAGEEVFDRVAEEAEMVSAARRFEDKNVHAQAPRCRSCKAL